MNKDYLHCLLLVFSPLSMAVGVYGLQHEGIRNTINPCNDLDKYIKQLSKSSSLTSYITLDRGYPPRRKYCLLKFNTCSDVIRDISGVNIAVAVTPKQLYDKIILNKHPNYSILKVWNRKLHGES